MSVEVLVGLISFMALIVAWAFIPTREEEEATAAEGVRRASATS